MVSERISELGLSQRELGKALGVSSSYVNKLVQGKRTLELTEFLDLCRVLGWNPATIVDLCSKQAD